MSPRFSKLPLVLGLVVALPVLVFRLIPGLVPYGGEEKLKAIQWSTPLLDSQGGVLSVPSVGDGLRRIPVVVDHDTANLVTLILEAEDKRFWFHPGFDPLALVRALVQNFGSNSTVSGASTISMQVARMINPRPRDIQSKIAEVWEALQLETRLGKRRVLELYLSLLPFGNNVEGFASAAKVFWDKSPQELDTLETLVLSVIPRSPRTYNPWTEQENVTAAVLRLPGIKRLRDQNSPEVLEAQVRTALGRVFDPGRKGIWPLRAPHFSLFVQGSQAYASRDPFKPFKTTLDPKVQASLELVLQREVDRARIRRISNAAAIFINPQTMEVLAYVGSADFYNLEDQGQIDGVQMLRQPGSTLKPFLYAMALERGLTPGTVLPDIPTDFGGSEVYVPANFNEQFNGPVRLRQALASSLNIPAVYTLEKIGVAAFTDFLIKNGFTSLLDQRGKLGLGLSLGNAEIRLWELAQAYGIFLHDGRPQSLVFQPQGAPKPREGLISPQTSALIRDILVRHPDRTLVFGRGGSMRMTYEGAIKTGTSNQFNNIWAAGFTPDLLGAVWMGNFGGATVVGSEGSAHPAVVLARILEQHSNHGNFPPLGDSGLEEHSICSLSGMLAGPNCPHARPEWFVAGTQDEPCTWHAQVNGRVETRYPQEYRQWLARYRYGGQNYQVGNLEIVKPLDQSIYWTDPRLEYGEEALRIEATGSGVGEILVGDQVVAQGLFPLTALWPLEPGTWTITVHDDSASKTIEVVVH